MIMVTSGSAVISTEWIWVSVVSIAPLSFSLSTLLPVMHEAAHGHILRHRQHNDAIGTIAGLLLCVNYQIYRQMHLQHHRSLGTSADPEVSVRIVSLWDYLSLFSPRYFLVPMWSAALNRRWKRSLPAKNVNRALAVWLACLAVLTAFLPLEMILLYWTPLVIAAGLIFFTTVAEHLAFPEEARPVTRSVKSNQLMRFFLWNTNYHFAHHQTPNLPPHLLDTLPPTVHGPMESTFCGFHRRLIGMLLKGKRFE